MQYVRKQLGSTLCGKIAKIAHNYVWQMSMR